ncbi:teichuronic acid biosynthesis protein TuaB [Thomasclavelia cocleata]|uniref:Teichuronic acid biosynthesis protein TuaB n=1 Tax=Thomasclavelia cocleata TaxID=69824 RepID=A0A829ZEX2_9FIRM|nr:lipopolysaccharide biosynthesis protein [Thomasclavelia cocleata]GFI41514.1 teichuronic acid biosynthesis protein TuaB [Thomasclavelia cocleata]
MENSPLKKNVVSGLFWRFSERTAAQGVSFIVSVVLARLLTPEDYGLIGLITVFISVATVFVSSGFGNALIQKENATQTDFSSVFYFSIFMGTAMYIVLFFAAPWIADFYNEPLLIPVIRVLSLSLIIAGVNSVQQAYVSKTMQFKRFFYSTIIGTVISAVIGIFMAYKGFGVWALVAQTLSNQVIDTCILWFTVKWRPAFEFSFSEMKKMFDYGWKLLFSSLLDTVYNNLYSLVIGKFYSAKDLGHYNRGRSIPNLVISNINGSIQSVMFPAFTNCQGDKVRLKAMVRRSIMTSTYIIMPAMIGLAAVAKPLTVLLLTDKWLPSVPFMQFSCFILAFWPIHTTNLQAINAVGRSDIFLKLEIIKKIVGFSIMFFSIPLGLYAMMIGNCFSAVLCSFLNASPNRKLLNYGYREQIKDILPAMFLSMFMGGVVLLWTFTGMSSTMILVCQVITGAVIYISGSKLLKLESYTYIIDMAKSFKK